MDRADDTNSNARIFSRAPPGLLASALLAIVAALATSTSRGHVPLTSAAFLGTYLTLILVRAALLAFRAPTPSGTWWRALTTAWLLAGAVWGTAVGGLLASRGMDRVALLLLLATAGLSAGVMPQLASRPRTLRANLSLVLVPALVGVMASPEPLAYRLAFAFNIAMFLAFLLVEVSRRYGELLRADANAVSLARHVKDLDAARLQALDALHAKGTFVANMSHEMRTPLTAILGYAELLDDQHLPTPERLRHARTIRKAGEHLLALVNDVLDLAKLDAGRLRVDRAPCSPSAILAAVASTLRVRAAEGKLEFEARTEGPLPATILSDGVRLTQILVNLVSNAIKFTDTGRVEVVASCEAAASADPQLVIRVIDTGIGIDEAHRARLFTSFTQGDESAARRHGGAGLGLVISRQLARMLGGDVTLEAHEGPGSTFCLRIPTGPLDGVPFVPDLQSAPESMGRVRRVAAAAIHLSGSVLLADDSEDNQRLIATLLRKAGATVSIAENGRQAVQMALAARDAGSPFGLILMDMQMPELDGVGATEELRAANYAGSIVALTAHAMSDHRARCLAAGCDAFLTKPVDRRRLFEVVREQLSRTPTSVRLRASGPRLLSTLEADPVLGDLVAEFVALLGDRARQIEEALVAGDVPALAKRAHQLVAEGGSFGFPVISAVARRVELAIADDDAPQIEAKVRELVELCLRAAAA